MGPGTVNVVPHSHYPTKDKRWIAIACTSDKIFARLAGAWSVPEWADEGKWGKIKQREAARGEVDAYVSHWTSQYTRDRLMTFASASRPAARSTPSRKSSRTRNTSTARTS